MAYDLPIWSYNESQGGYGTYKGIEYDSQGKVPLPRTQDSGGLHPENMEDTRVYLFEDQPQTILDTFTCESLYDSTAANSMPSAAEAILESIRPGKHPKPSEPVKLTPVRSFTDSFELLSHYKRGNESSRDEKLKKLCSKVGESGRKLSTEEIMRVAAERYIQFSNKELDGITTFIHPYGSAFSSLSKEESRGADLVHLLLAAAEKVGAKQYDSANRVLNELVVSDSGNPVERVIFYFSEALHKKITRETGTTTGNEMSEQQIGSNGLSAGTDFTFLATYKKIPFNKVIHFAATQQILESVGMASSVHLIDLQIRSGIHLIGLMQALSERKRCPVELLKITAVATTGKQKVEEIGKRLQSFAMSLNMHLKFQVIFLQDMKDIYENLFDTKVGEAVVVYCPTILRTMISRPDSLENLMRVIQNLRPSIMVVCETEASDNSPSFVNRFTEALFFYGAYFDCLEDCMDRENPYRIDVERNHLGKGIVNTLATEGDERITRNVNLEMWRAFFARFQMVEIGLSKSSLYQARLVLEQQFSCGSSCTLTNNRRSLVVGWKGTPICSLSVWKFK